MNNTNTANNMHHYYGDIVRYLFIMAAVLMLVALPVLNQYIHLPTVFSVISILVLALFAGLTNPRQGWVAGANVAIATVGFLVFETYAVTAYRNYGSYAFFFTNLVLGFIFLISLYYSVKTLRGLLLANKM